MHVKTLKLYRSLHILLCPRYVSCKLLALIRALVPAFTFPYTALPTTYSTWTAVVDSWVAYEIWDSLSFNNILLPFQRPGRFMTFVACQQFCFTMETLYIVERSCDKYCSPLPSTRLSSRGRYELLRCLRPKWSSVIRHDIMCSRTIHCSSFE